MPAIPSRRRAALALLAALPLVASAAQPGAKDPVYPGRPVRIIVPFAPGGPTDLMARLLGTKLTEQWGQQVIVDNRPGASANIAIGLAAKAAPDGHTMLLTTHAIVVNPSLHDKLPWHPLRDSARSSSAVC
jgi:tripartite-type tricarboxylate transporter receptor subunit TctC